VRAALEALFRQLWWLPQPRWAAVLSTLCLPVATLYGFLQQRQRNAAPTPRPSPVPVVVVGNLVAGGAGKTPTVVALVQSLRDAGHRPGIVSRGHGRRGDGVRRVTASDTAASVGDEPLLLARRCAVPVVVGRDRPAAVAALLAAHPETDVIVADDGLQHHALHRDAALLVFDDRGVGNGRLLPAGPLRQPLPARVPDASWVLYTGTRQSTPLHGPLMPRCLHEAWPLAAWQAQRREGVLSLSQLRGRPLLAAAGLAAPEKFFAMLHEAGLTLQTPLPLPDHFDFTTLPWSAEGCDVVLTEKDAIKLPAAMPASPGTRAVWVLPLDSSLPSELARALHGHLFGAGRKP
jgi:tetraacyldisaccharide 4'-kinase